MLQLRWHLLLFGRERFLTSKSIGFEGVGGRFREKRSKKVFTAEARGGP